MELGPDRALDLVLSGLLLDPVPVAKVGDQLVETLLIAPGDRQHQLSRAAQVDRHLEDRRGKSPQSLLGERLDAARGELGILRMAGKQRRRKRRAGVSRGSRKLERGPRPTFANVRMYSTRSWRVYRSGLKRKKMSKVLGFW